MECYKRELEQRANKDGVRCIGGYMKEREREREGGKESIEKNWSRKMNVHGKERR